MEAKHESGSVIWVSRPYDARTLQLLADSGYTHVRTPGNDWHEIYECAMVGEPATKEQKANWRQKAGL